MRFEFLIYGVLLWFSLLSSFSKSGWAEPPQTDAPAQASDPASLGSSKAPSDLLHAAFEKRMSGSSLVGRFTTDGSEKSGEPREEGAFTKERYDILSVKKMEKGDYWFITTRIRYGELDISVPVPVEVKWAGKTPVITLDSVKIPGLGTFDAHVLIHKGAYAGTWRHDEQGGHLFGKIERTVDEEK